MLKILLALTLHLSLFAFHSVELNINEKDLNAKVDLDMGQYNETIDPDTTFIGFSYLKMTHDHSSLSEDPKDLIDAHFLMQRAVSGFEDLVLGLGAKFVYTSYKTTENRTFFAIPFGLKAKYRLPLGWVIPIYIGGDIYYSPAVLSLGDAKNYLETNVKFEIEIIDRASVIGGYRNVETNYEFKDIRLNESLYGGVKFLF